MQPISQALKHELLQLKKNEYVDKTTLNDSLKHLEENVGFIRDTNPIDHFCAFFIPIDPITKQIFMGHHKKAKGWVPPGGHIDKDETPIETVKREFFEELNSTLTNEKIELFDTTKIYINNTQQPCRVHRDFWYLVFIDKIDFTYDKREFYETRWMSITEVKKLNKFPEFKTVYETLETKYT